MIVVTRNGDTMVSGRGHVSESNVQGSLRSDFGEVAGYCKDGTPV